MVFGKTVFNQFLSITCFFILVSSGWAFSGPVQNTSDKKESSDVKGEKKMEEAFKNIKVMKGEPASQLGPTMHFFEAALGFNCGNCHVRDGFEKDDKPEKRKARDMMVMMNALNKENFKGEQLVTCFTCHHGTADPEVIPVVVNASSLNDKKNEDSKDEIVKIPNRLNSADEIIAKYQQSIGGKEAFDKITSLKLVGKIESGKNNESETTIYEKAPCLYYSETKSSHGTMQRGFNGESGWFKTPQYQRKLDGDDLVDLKLGADFYAPLNFEKNYSGLKLDNVEIIDNDTVYVVNGISSTTRSFKFFFDAKSGLLVRQIQYNKTLFGELQSQTDYKDYRSVNGVLFPYELDVADYEHIQKFKFDAITPNVPVDEKMFDMAGK